MTGGRIRRSIPLIVMVVAAMGLGPAATGAADDEGPLAAATAAPDTGVVAYYFHGNKRCSTCRKLEAYSKEAIETGFADRLESGALSWRAVNVDRPADAHFVTDFELVTKALVLVEYRDGEVVRWRNLKLIWQLVGDKDGFLTYVRRETGEFLEAG